MSSPQSDRDLRRQIVARSAASADNVSAVIQSFNNHLHFTQVKDRSTATLMDCYKSLALCLWDVISAKWIRTRQHYTSTDPKRVYYLSAEYCLGRSLANLTMNNGVLDDFEVAMHRLGLYRNELMNVEPEVDLSNGGCGRVAACFLDSMATLGIAGFGYGIRYDHGMFKQTIEDGWQIEHLDDWLRYGNVWEVLRAPECNIPVPFYGRLVRVDEDDEEWVDTSFIYAMPYDSPISGYKNNFVNTLRLWSAKASEEFSLKKLFNDDDYIKAVEDSRSTAENISKAALYTVPEGNNELRLKQQYFLVSATIQDIIRRFKFSQFFISAKDKVAALKQLPEKVAIQLNDTQTALAIPELMRVLIDAEHLSFDDAFVVTRKTCAYTSHSLVAETFEKWPTAMLKRVLPRHLSIIRRIDEEFLHFASTVWRRDAKRAGRVAIIQYFPTGKVNMAHLAIVGTHTVNGLSARHTELIKTQLFKDFFELWPERFKNSTSGVTPRRWLLLCNSFLAETISIAIGFEWTADLRSLKDLLPLLADKQFVEEIATVKHMNKLHLVTWLLVNRKIMLDPAAMFDVHVARVVEDKRQLLNVLHVITLYNRIRKDPTASITNRVVIMGGKAAPGHIVAKKIIKLINCVADVVNSDPVVDRKLKLVFLPNYGSTLAEKVVPAADLSEQIALAGTESSGTGRMKFMLNGALTIGTLDGANAEIAEEAGAENMFLFGMTAQQVNELRNGGYNPEKYYSTNPELQLAIDQIGSGYFSPNDTTLFCDVVDNLLKHGDYYMLCADFQSYAEAQKKASDLFRNKEAWGEMVIKNIAACGKFSSDRAIAEYANHIWRVEPDRQVLPLPQYDGKDILQ